MGRFRRREMKLLKVKRWHWALIAVVAGLAFAFSHMNNVTPIGVWSITPGEFKRQVQQQPWSNRAAFLDDITVHPVRIEPDGKKSQLVIMARWTFDKRSNQWGKNDCAFEAAVPFTRESGNTDTGTAEHGTVLAFLGNPGGQRTGILYRYAWWELPAVLYGIAVAASLLLIAGILPTVIQIAAAAGASSSNQVKPLTPSATAFAHVDEPVVAKAVEPEDPSTVTQLATEPLAADSPPDNEKIKRYSGEFYPVSLAGQDSSQDKK